MERQRRTTTTLFVVSLVIISGCATIGVESTLNADGTIEKYVINIDTSRQVYGFIQSSAEDEGYDSVNESLVSDINETAVGSIEYNENISGDDVTMTITMRNVEPAGLDNVTVTESGGNISYVDTTFYNESTEPGQESEMSEAISSGFAVDYSLTMPGEIVETNADEVDGEKAEWHATGSDAFTDTRIYAKSKVSSSGLGPGLGVIPGLVALLLLTGFIVLRREMK